MDWRADWTGGGSISTLISCPTLSLFPSIRAQHRHILCLFLPMCAEQRLTLRMLLAASAATELGASVKHTGSDGRQAGTSTLARTLVDSSFS